MKRNFKEEIKNSILVLDGAMGTSLYKMGLPPDKPPEYANLKHPEWVYEVHRGYVSAGADIIVTNTFGANPFKMKEHSLDKFLKEIIVEGVKIAKDASKGRCFVSTSIGPTGKFLEPVGDLSFDSAVSIFRKIAEIAIEAGTDLFSLETFIDIRELKSAVIGIREVSSDIPIIAMMTFDRSLKTVLGTPPEVAGIVLESLPVDVIGVNCGLGPDGIYEALRRMSPYTDKPLISQPNAGVPVVKDGITLYPAVPEDFSKLIEEKIKIGVVIFGGCCGTGPEHIEELKRSLKDRKPNLSKRKDSKKIYLASRTSFIAIGNGEPVRLIGERINPSRRKRLTEELKNRSFSTVREEAIGQAGSGAEIIDVNVGIPEEDEKELMRRAVMEVNLSVQVPVSIDSPSPEVIEEGLKSVDGKPLINSTSADEEKMKKVFSLAKKYGGAVVGLTMDERGIPETPDGRVELAKKIMKVAKEYMVEVLIDPIVLPIGSNSKAGVITLETIKRIKDETGAPVILGLSNISFGMPEREFINSAFLSMCILKGADVVIGNPMSEIVMKTLKISEMITGRRKIEEAIKWFKREVIDEEKNGIDLIKKAVMRGDIEKVEFYVNEALKDGYSPIEVNNMGIVPALKELGILFERGDIFLPQLMRSAETAKKAFEILKKHFEKKEEKKARILFATVEGDIHDIGKNIVITLLEADGFEVIDLGKNVKTEEILNAIERTSPDFVALSCLMTTTLPFMRKSVKAIKERFGSIPVAVGGAVLTKKLAEEMGADIYGEDAVTAVKIFNEFLKR
jgi:5-methyltetrahydrofolate--homocysteine methyltransferase